MGNAIPAAPAAPLGGGLDGRWFRRLAAPQAPVRLFCLPYAGGTAGIYRKWHDWMAPDVDVVAVELPGRGVHPRGPLAERMDALVDRLLQALDPLFDLPFAFFGHSLGGLIAFELCRALRDRGQRLPVHLFVSAVEAPHRPARGMRLHELPDGELIERVRVFNPGAAEALANRELQEIVLPTLRADFRLAETYAFAGGRPLPHPITAFGGLDDRAVSREGLDAWDRHTQDRCVVRLVAGGHFFIHEYEHLMAASVARCLRGPVPAGPLGPRG